MSNEASTPVTFGIVTALTKEYAAMKAMLDLPRDDTMPSGRSYCIGQIPAKGGGIHSVVLKLGDQGTSAATYHATLLMEDYPEVESILMVGIAGGVPHVSKPECHVRLGDIVVSGEQGVIAHDFVKEHPDWREERHPPRPPDADLLHACRRLEAGSLEGNFPWLIFLQSATKLPDSQRPLAETDRLADTTDPTIYIEHPTDPQRRLNEPRVFIGTIGCGNTLLKDPKQRDHFRDQFDFRAIAMEEFGIAEATWSGKIGYLVIRGICDYCDTHKNDKWQGHAAVVAAAYARAVLEEMPKTNPKGGITRQVRKEAPSEEALQQFAQKLISAGRPPALLPLFSNTTDLARRVLGNLELVPRSIRAALPGCAKEEILSEIGELVTKDELHHMIVAPPGSGKTHALWHAAQNMLSKKQPIPIFIPTSLASKWGEVLDDLSKQAGDLDVSSILQDSRTCVFLDGWSEFAQGQDDSERLRAMQSLHGSRVIANGRYGFNPDSRFLTWELDPLSPAIVRNSIMGAFPGLTPPPAQLNELLRLPLALSLYILLGGSASSRGELIARFHEHLSRNFPESFRGVLAGAVAAVDLRHLDRSYTQFDGELRRRATQISLVDYKDLFNRLGTIERRGNIAAPIHDLYWSWLSGVGLIAENKIDAAIPHLSSRESLGLALESGETPTAAQVSLVKDLDAPLAGLLSTSIGAGSDAVRQLRDTFRALLDDSRLPVRFRGALSVLHSRDGHLLGKALQIISETCEAKIHMPALAEALNPTHLYVYRGILANWIGAPGTDQLLDAIASYGDSRWSIWLEQMMNDGKIPVEKAIATTLACVGDIPSWTASYLPRVIMKASHRLRVVGMRGANLPLARWIAEHYEQYVQNGNSTFIDLNAVLTGCGDESVFERLLARYDSMPNNAQEQLECAFVSRGDPWLSRLQIKAFSSSNAGHHHGVVDKLSLEIDDATARLWVKQGPEVLGWRVLIARHGNTMLPELLQRLPISFDGLHKIPVLKAMSYLKNPPDFLADKIWARIRGAMQPLAMQDALNALAPIRNRGIPSVVSALSRDPFFLPSYHLIQFIRLLKSWQTETRMSFEVRSKDESIDFIEYILLHRFAKDRIDPMFIHGIRRISDIAVPILLKRFEAGDETCLDLIAAAGSVPKFHAKLVEHLLKTPNKAALITKLFAKCFDTFPEEILFRVLDAPGVDFHLLIGAIAASSNPVHSRIHVAVARRVLDAPINIWSYRSVAQMLRVHPRPVLQELLREIAPVMTENALWLMREVEVESNELLIAENGAWINS